MIRWSDWQDIALDVAVPGHDIIPSIFQDPDEPATSPNIRKLRARLREERRQQRRHKRDRDIIWYL